MARVTMSPGTSSRASMCFSFPSLMLCRDSEMVVVGLALLLTLCWSYPHPSFGRYVVLGSAREMGLSLLGYQDGFWLRIRSG